MQVGAEYVRHVSSLVKNSIASLRLASSNLTSEGLCSLGQKNGGSSFLSIIHGCETIFCQYW